ncbi:MAG: acyl-CoA dehydrogenase family protein, partial [Pseudomonadota bacterium]
MRFGLSEDQTALVDAILRYLQDNVPLDTVRKYADGDDSIGDTIWAGLTELGVPGLIIPENQGGVGLNMMDAALAAEQLGHHVVPVPFISTSVIVLDDGESMLRTALERYRQLGIPVFE